MKDAYYFPHDSNAKDDPKCIMLIEQLGLEGYGIFWVLVETLRDQPQYRYPIALLPALARRFNTTPDKMKIVVNGYGLFDIEDDEFFFSRSLRTRMEKLDSKREQARLAGAKSGAMRALATKTPIENKDDLPQVYVIKCFNDNEEFIKIGATNTTISRRYSGHLPYNYIVLKQFFTKQNCQLETELHNQFKQMLYSPKIKFTGDAECYNISALNEILEYIPITQVSCEHRFNIGSTSVQHRLDIGSTSKVNKSKVNESKENHNTALENAVEDFKEFRRKLKKPMTDRAIQLLFTELNKLAQDDETKIAIINQSIMNGWQGVFPLKDNKIISMPEKSKYKDQSNYMPG